MFSSRPNIVLTRWESMEHFQAWVNSQEFKARHARAGSLVPQVFAGRSQLEIHEVVQDNRGGRQAP